jgi:uncharacterized phage-associated protein
MTSSVDFAKFLLTCAKDKQLELDETQLHKLLYICNGCMLALGVDIISDAPCAWNYGPVYSEVRDWLQHNKVVLTSPPSCSEEARKELDKIGARNIVDKALDTYGNLSAEQLSMWSHAPDAPWDKAIARHGGLGCLISKKDMKNYFKILLK